MKTVQLREQNKGRSFIPTPASFVLQRKCICGGSAGMAGQCAKCSKKRADSVQRSALSHQHHNDVPPIVHDVLRSPGEPLDPAIRAYFEPRFGHDFGRVQVHADARAAASSRAVNALAYTAGNHMVFGTEQYRPHTQEGRQLLAHELTHVVQQHGHGDSGSVRLDDTGETEAERSAVQLSLGQNQPVFNSFHGPRLQRKVRVLEPDKDIPNPGGTGVTQTNAATIEVYFDTLCPSGNVTVVGKTGEVGMDKGFCDWPAKGRSPAVQSGTTYGCAWTCILVNSKHDWRVEVNDKEFPHTTYDNPDAAYGRRKGGTGGKVVVPSPNSAKGFGARTVSGKEMAIDPWLIFGHELLGHGLGGEQGIESKDFNVGRQVGTVVRENLLRLEHGIEKRGETFKDPFCGESFEFDKSDPSKTKPSSHLADCIAWRNAYNKKQKTKYKLEDRIP